MKPLIEPPKEWGLSHKELYTIYTVEKEQSNVLRTTVGEERRKKYGEVYEAYFEKLPFHPQFTLKHDEVKRKNRLLFQLEIVQAIAAKKTGVFVEIGAGDCTLSVALAPFYKEVQAMEVSESIAEQIGDLPQNVSLLIFDGFHFPQDDCSIDVAYSNQLMEHLHEEDALLQLKEIHRILKKGGQYICLTPNRLVGPNDISRFYSNTLEGFHLKEYTATELAAVFKNIGFSKVKAYWLRKSGAVTIPLFVIRMVEWVLALFPVKMRRRIVKNKVISILFNTKLVAVK